MGDGWGRLAALRVWRSPAEQPRWARPALLGVAAVAAFCYAWGNTGLGLEDFYGAAARSMSQSWHNFFFASFDPWGTVSIDKLPGAFWLQALSLRIFGFHLWALVLPQVIEGTLTVLVLYRVVRRVAGPVGGLAAAAALALSPVTVLLNRGNVSDTLLILLLVLAADATTWALMSGQLRSLLLAGVWVGLAFQAKMVQAWLVIPALAVAYLLAAPAASLARRSSHVVAMGAVTLVVSLSWMSAVALVPAHDRPYVDGSCNNSIYSQVFLYNGADRVSGHELDHPGCVPTPKALTTAAAHTGLPGTGTVAVSGGLGKFLAGVFGRLVGWLFIPSVVASVALYIWRRKQPRTDAVRAAAVLWFTWLVITWAFFNASKSLNSYYLAALVPPMAALCGLGLEAARQRRDDRRVRVVVAATGAAGTLYGISLIPASAGLHALIVTTLVIGAAGALGALALVRRRGSPQPGGRTATLVMTATLLIGPAWATGTAVWANLGPFDAPFQAASLTAALHKDATRALDDAPRLREFVAPIPNSVAADTSETSGAVSINILLTGHEFLPIGGFSGRVPSPTLGQFVAEVRAGKVRRVTVTLDPATTNQDMRWVRSHCARLQTKNSTFVSQGVTFGRFLCGA